MTPPQDRYRWTRRLVPFGIAAFFVLVLPAAHFAGRVWAASYVPGLLRQHWSVVVLFTSVAWLGWLSVTAFLLWYQLYKARDLETLLTLPLSPSQLFWRKLGSHSLALDATTILVVIAGTWAFCHGSGAGWPFYLTLPLLAWAHLLAIETAAALLALWPAGRFAAGMLFGGAVSGFFVLLEATAERSVGPAPGIDWQTLLDDLARAPWTLVLPPRWALEALASGSGGMAVGAAIGATLGLALVTLALVRLSLPRVYGWEKLVAAREAAAIRAPGSAVERRSSWLAREVAGALPPRSHAVLRAATQSPAPERRLDLLVPLAVAWTAAGAVIRTAAEHLWPLFPGTPLATPVFLGTFCVPVLAAFLGSVALAMRGVPPVLPRGDRRQPPVQALPVSFDAHLGVALASNLAHLAGLTLITLPFVALIPFPFRAYLVALAAALWLAVLSALARAAGPRISPRRRFPVLRRLAAPVPWLILVALAVLLVEEGLLFLSLALLPPAFAVAWWWLRRQRRRRWFDVEEPLASVASLSSQ